MKHSIKKVLSSLGNRKNHTMPWTKTLKKNRTCGVIIKDSNILLIHRIRDGREYWAVPGGGIEEGESIEQALHRELAEELGIQVKEKKFLFEIKNAGRSEYYFLITEYEGTPKMGGPEMGRMNERNQYILEERKIAEIPKINVLPKTIVGKLQKYLQ